jgi:hypothetical protein
MSFDLSDSLIVVTGFPRAGTSLVMSMLKAGGLPVLTDCVRQPDENNPRGYFEYAPVSRLAYESGWLLNIRGQAVKIVIPLVRHLHLTSRVRVIWIQRSLDEVLASQAAMLTQRGLNNRGSSPLLRAAMQKQAEATENLFAANPTVAVLRLTHSDLISDPASVVAMLDYFLGSGLAVNEMVACVDPSLHRQRREWHPECVQLTRSST